jgi:type II secretory pathway component PulC
MQLKVRLRYLDQTLLIMRWTCCGTLFLVACLCGWQTAASLRPSPMASPASPASIAVHQPALREEELAGQLADMHLFGIAPPAATSDAPVSALSTVRVIGIISVEPPAKGWAMLDLDGRQDSYQAGSMLPDGETLEEVQADRVVLEKNGNRYSVVYSELWDMQHTNLNVRLESQRSYVIGYTGDTKEQNTDGSDPAHNVPSTLQALHDLRQQLLNKPRQSLAPISETPPSNPSNSSPNP